MIALCPRQLCAAAEHTANIAVIVELSSVPTSAEVGGAHGTHTANCTSHSVSRSIHQRMHLRRPVIARNIVIIQ